jgi:hypothetical protein
MNGQLLTRSSKTTTAILLCALMLDVASWGQCAKDTQNCSPPVRVESQTSPFIGCYQLTLGKWWPWAFGEDTKYVTPPTRVRLLPERGAEGFEQNGFLLRAVPTNKRTTYVRGGPSYWQVESTNQIDLIWTDGFTGVTLKLEKQGYELRGWAHPHFDAASLIPRTARVVARPTACDAP